MLEAMAREASLKRAGSAGILSRLADVVAASIVRGWVECGCGDIGGWVEALRDPRLGKVIAAVHREPGRDWTVATMAAEAGSSRSLPQLTGYLAARLCHPTAYALGHAMDCRAAAIH